MTAINTGKGRLKVVTIKGVDLTSYVRHVAIRESICTPYLSGEIMIVDNNNVINNLELVGGEPVYVSFDAPINPKSYDQDLYVLSFHQQPSPENFRSIIYTISVVGSEFYTDRGGMVVESAKGMSGTQLSQKIWSELGFESALNTPTQDKPLSDGNEPFQINYMKPFTAISQIREYMIFPQYPTGNVLHYRDAEVSNIVPLEYLFDSMSAQEHFIQKATWGTEWRDVFESDRAIIYAGAQTRNQTGFGGRGGAGEVSSVSSQGKRVFDMLQGKVSKNLFMGSPITSAIGSISTLVQGSGIASKFGGAVNLPSTNSDRTASASDFSEKIEAERLYAANVKASPQYNIRVPLQRGINCTVGKGAHFDLLPPVGDQKISRSNPAGGLMLITDLVHDVYNDAREVTGTTTFQVMKGTIDY